VPAATVDDILAEPERGLDMLRPQTAFTVVAWTLIASLAVHAGRQQPPPASFRSRITIVPIDVRVLDRNGKPVTDLTQDDFTIVEDGVPQAIRHFSTQALTAETPAPGAQPELRKAAMAADLAPQNRRVFLLLLGRGRMKGPSKEIPAVLEFFQKRLLPQDQVAVLAFNRGTDFTTNHATA
jgi:VWFA-related protein